MVLSQDNDLHQSVDSTIRSRNSALALAVLALALAASALALFAAPALAAAQTLKVTITGSGSVDASTGAIAACEERTGTCEGPYAEATTVVLTAVPAAHYHLEQWTGCTSQPSEDECEVTIGSEETLVKAAFAPNLQTLTVSSQGEGSVRAESGTISHCEEAAGTCQGPYAEGTIVTLYATPAPFHAVAWTGCTRQPAEDVCVIEIPAADAEVSVSFSQVTQPLYIAKTGTGSGQVACNGGTCAVSYPAGTQLSITAMPAAGSIFVGWNGGSCSGIGACQLTLEVPTALTATFTATANSPAFPEGPTPRLTCRRGFLRRHDRCVRRRKLHHHHPKR